MCMQKFIKIFQTVYELWTFLLTVRGQILHKLTRDKQLHKLSQCDYRAHSESQTSASLSVDVLMVVQFVLLMLIVTRLEPGPIGK